MEGFEHQVVVEPTHPALAGHFPDDPIVPGALLLAEVVARVERVCGRRVVRVARVKFPAVLAPAVGARLRVEPQGADCCRAVCSGEGATFLEAVLETEP